VNNTKGENRFFVLKSGEGNVTYNTKAKELVVLFEYRALTEAEKSSVGTRNVQDTLNEQAKEAIIAAVPDAGLKAGLTRETEGKIPLAKHIATYAKRNTSDYFIHKDLAGFLTRELDFYIKNEMFDLDDLGTDKEVPIEQYLNRVRVMKAISLKIIAFLAQIEDFQKKLFEKKKFVLKSEYCMTMDRVPKFLYAEIVANTAQIEEWKALYSIGESTGQATLSGSRGNIIDIEFLKSHPYLVLDTIFFPQEFKDRLLASFDNLDDATGGLMVKSENWQALNLLQERYREQVKCIYIDPPYNTGSDEFLYKDNYQHSSWLTMMEERTLLSKKLLSDVGIYYSSIDDHEVSNQNKSTISIFGEDNLIALLVWKKKAGGGSDAVFFADDHEYILSVAQNKMKLQRFFTGLTDELREEYKFKDKNFEKLGPYKRKNLYQTGIETDRPNLKYPITAPDGTKILPPTIWRWEEPRFLQAVREGKIDFIKNNAGDWQVYTKMYLFNEKGEEYQIKPRSLLLDIALTRDGNTELKKIFGISPYSYPKPSKLIKYLLKINTKEKDIILDYFSGSGTTAHAVLNLNSEDKGNRKYLLVEMADYFDTVMKPRIQKVVYSSEWKEGKPQNTDGISHIFKYLILEQYEDTLNNIEFKEAGTVQKTLIDLEGYLLRYMLDFETRESPCRMSVAKLERPFEYSLRVTRDNQLHNETVDLVETFNYLLGLKVKRIRTFKENGTIYRVVHGETLAGQSTTVIWRTTIGLDLKKDKKYIEETLLKDPKLKAERVYINGDFHVEGALPIEPEFQRLMGA